LDRIADARTLRRFAHRLAGQTIEIRTCEMPNVDDAVQPRCGKYMSDDSATQRSDADAAPERKIREDRNLILEEALARIFGPVAMKDVSPVAGSQEAEIEIGSWLKSHLTDSGGALHVVLHRYVKGSELLVNNFEEPLVVLAGYCKRVLDSDYLLNELVRDADAEWGRLMGARPFLDKHGSLLCPDAPYSVESVRKALHGILEQLAETERLTPGEL
jgi:hypothetical protein